MARQQHPLGMTQRKKFNIMGKARSSNMLPGMTGRATCSITVVVCEATSGQKMGRTRTQQTYIHP